MRAGKPQVPRCNQRHFEIINIKDAGASRRQTRCAPATQGREPVEILALVKQVLWCVAAVVLIATCIFMWFWAVPTIEGALADVQQMEATYAQR